MNTKVMRKLFLCLSVIGMILTGCSKNDDGESDKQQPENPDEPELPELPALPDPDDVCSAMDDLNFMSYCYENFDVNKDGKVSVNEANAVRDIKVSYKSIKSLRGVERFPNLEKLSCSYNELTSLDCRYNSNLNSLVCTENSLRSLDVSRNIFLTNLECGENPLELLKLGDVLPKFGPYDYPYFSDGINEGGYKATLKSSTTFTIISSGIKKLNVNRNNLQSLDISKCPALTELLCFDNKITDMDFSTNINMQEVNCSHNSLTVLDLSKNIDLNILDCSSNQLTMLNLGANKKLEKLNCSSNHSIESIDIHNLSSLLELYCASCKLFSLNISKNPSLQLLDCRFNPLEELNCGNTLPKFKSLSSSVPYDFPCFREQSDPLTPSTQIKIIGSGITDVIFDDCKSLKVIDISQCGELSVVSLITRCSSLETVVLPATLFKIESSAFYQCNNLNSVRCYALTPPIVNTKNWDISKRSRLYVPASSIASYQTADFWKDFQTILPIN